MLIKSFVRCVASCPRHDRTSTPLLTSEQIEFQIGNLYSYSTHSTAMGSDNKANKDIDSKKNSFFAVYKDLLIRYPFLVNATQGAIFALIAGLISQWLLNVPSFDWNEIYVMMLIGFAFNTPVLIWWSGVLQKLKLSIYLNLILDQLAFSPVFTASIISLRHYLKSGDISSIPTIVLEVVPKAQSSSWLFWIPVRFLILLYVPPIYQLLAGNLGALVWNIIFFFLMNTSK